MEQGIEERTIKTLEEMGLSPSQVNNTFSANDFYQMLEKNKKAFLLATTEELPEVKLRGGRDSATQVLRILKTNEISKFKGFTEDDELYISRIIKELEEGGLPKQTSKTLLKEVDQELKKGVHPLRILALLKKNIPAEFLQEPIAQSSAKTFGPREVILSEYLVNE